MSNSLADAAGGHQPPAEASEPTRSELLAALRTALEAVVHAGQRCRYHGTNFGFLDFYAGLPRCESCQQPYRNVRALDAIDRALRTGTTETAGPVPADGQATTVIVIVAGQPLILNVNAAASLRELIALALARTGSDAGDGWELRDAHGALLDPRDEIRSLSLRPDERLFLNRRAGWGG